MRNLPLSCVIIGYVFFGSIGPSAAESGKSALAGAYEPSPPAASEMAIIDLMAADFYENSLRLAQTFKIEAQTAADYQYLPEDQRQLFRSKRRDIWRALSDEQRQTLRGVKRPQFLNLSENQKDPFRKIAFDRLTGAPRPETVQAQWSASENEI